MGHGRSSRERPRSRSRDRGYGGGSRRDRSRSPPTRHTDAGNRSGSKGYRRSRSRERDDGRRGFGGGGGRQDGRCGVRRRRMSGLDPWYDRTMNVVTGRMLTCGQASTAPFPGLLQEGLQVQVVVEDTAEGLERLRHAFVQPRLRRQGCLFCATETEVFDAARCEKASSTSSILSAGVVHESRLRAQRCRPCPPSRLPTIRQSSPCRPGLADVGATAA